mgnify:CR=1 FL=1
MWRKNAPHIGCCIIYRIQSECQMALPQFYIIIFSLILAVTYASLAYFYPSMSTLHAEVPGFQPFASTNDKKKENVEEKCTA